MLVGLTPVRRSHRLRPLNHGTMRCRGPYDGEEHPWIYGGPLAVANAARSAPHAQIGQCVNSKRKRRSHGRARAAARLARTAAAVRSGGPLGARLRSARSLLVIVDMQERIADAVADAPRVLHQCEILLRAASALSVPVLVTEHCPQQLGSTVASLREHVPPRAIHAKTHFAASDEPALAQDIAACSRPQIVIAGVEAHVCVLQTAVALAERGYSPYVVADATGSRLEESRALALERLRGVGVPVVSTEMVLFEWLERAERPQLRELLALIR